MTMVAGLENSTGCLAEARTDRLERRRPDRVAKVLIETITGDD